MLAPLNYQYMYNLYCRASFSKIAYMRKSKEGQGSRTPPLKNHKKGILSHAGPDPLKNYNATKPAFNVAPSSYKINVKKASSYHVTSQLIGELVRTYFKVEL